MARLSESNAERDTHRLTKKFKLTVPVPLTSLMVGKLQVPFLKMSSWANFLMENNLFHHLTGLKSPDHDRCCRIWSEFWARYRAVCPDHDVFKRNDIDLQRTIGLLLHGDEGTSAKKLPILVLATHSVLGYGIRTAKTTCPEPYVSLKLNYEQPSWTTRFLLAVMPRACYANDDKEDDLSVFQDLLQGIASDLRELFEQGICDKQGRRFWFCVISVMGDWPWLHKSGCLKRTFYNAAKRSSGQQGGKGICHLCMADTPGVVWEDWEAATPAWVPTYNTASPFLRRPALLDLPLVQSDPASLFDWDLFHAWHIGSGKPFLASAIVTLATSRHFQGSQDHRIDTVSDLFMQWCKANRVTPHMKKLSKQKLSWITSTDYPQGTWSKGAATTALMKWFLSECKQRANAISQDPDQLLQVVYCAAFAMNEFLRGLYKEQVWIPAPEAARLARLGKGFLRRNGMAIRMAYESGRNLFIQMPNLHRIQHIVLELARQSECAEFALNPLGVSSQVDEDYIGRPSRISRSVHGRTVITRTLERALEATWAKYVEAGLLILDRD